MRPSSGSGRWPAAARSKTARMGVEEGGWQLYRQALGSDHPFSPLLQMCAANHTLRFRIGVAQQSSFLDSLQCVTCCPETQLNTDQVNSWGENGHKPFANRASALPLTCTVHGARHVHLRMGSSYSFKVQKRMQIHEVCM